MKNAAIYNRVSTDNQEREGTSLGTQLEACTNYCHEKGFDVSSTFSEAYSGLSLERPELDKLRELVRSETIDTVVVYALDRLTRDPENGCILMQEMDKHHITLLSVTEEVDNTEIGKLFSYIRGFASKMEAAKIKERSLRGRRARAKEGRMPGGCGINVYGYDYVRVSQKDGGRRVINETEAPWVLKIFQWLVNEGMSINGITTRLQAMNAPTKSGKPWNRSSVLAILGNIVFTGKTFVFTTKKGTCKQFTRPESDWVEIEGVTPAIISDNMFADAQKQLQANRAKTMPQTKRDYLLRGHIRCKKCGKAYVGKFSTLRYYHCLENLKRQPGKERCRNKTWNAAKLEDQIWTELQRFLSNRDLIKSEMDKRQDGLGQVEALEDELKQVEHQLKTVEQEQHQLLQWALKGFPENQVESENRRLNKSKTILKARRAELEAQIKTSTQACVNLPDIERFIDEIQKRLPELDFEGKRLALDMLGIDVYIDGQTAEVKGVIAPENDVPRCSNDQSRLTI